MEFGRFPNHIPCSLSDRRLASPNPDIFVDVSIPETTDRVHHVCLVHRYNPTIGQSGDERGEPVLPGRNPVLGG